MSTRDDRNHYCSSQDNRDFYELLQVSRRATEAEIRQAFHCLARVHHPDKRLYRGKVQDQIAEDEETGRVEPSFPALLRAYEVLSDSGKRALYELELERKHSTSQAADPSNGRNGPYYELDLDEFEFEERERLYTYPCQRCSEDYIISERQLEGEVMTSSPKARTSALAEQSTPMNGTLSVHTIDVECRGCSTKAQVFFVKVA